MPGFVKSTQVTDEKRQANDRHTSWRVVAAVFLVLLAYAYLFTNAGQWVGLPLPGDVAESLGVIDSDLMFEDGIADSPLQFDSAQRLTSDNDGLLVFLPLTALAFLAFYFLPLPLKRPSVMIAALIALGLIWGVPILGGLLFAHLFAYMIFHPTRRWLYFPVLGILGATAFAEPEFGEWLMWVASLSVGTAVLYLAALRPLLERPHAGKWVRRLTAHSTLIAMVVFVLIHTFTGVRIVFQLGLLFFFWQIVRLIMYEIDYSDGLVPKNTSLPRYLAVFFSPGGVINAEWGIELGLGYAYCNNSFLSRDKNLIVMDGVKLMWVAMGYLMLGDWARNLLLDGLSMIGLDAYGSRIALMVDDFMSGGEVSMASVLVTSLLDTLRWTLEFVGILHLRTGLWRICGYDFAPYFNKPWLATNLVVFWTRYTYYYREFLLQTFYYPVFLRFFKKSPRIRLVVATVAAAGLGNLIWGHMTYNAPRLVEVLHTWPYYVLLSAGIAFTALYLYQFSKRKKRRPWTKSPWLITDVLAAYCTMQYFALIHIMSRPSSGSTEWDLFRLMLRGVGIFL